MDSVLGDFDGSHARILAASRNRLVRRLAHALRVPPILSTALHTPCAHHVKKKKHQSASEVTQPSVCKEKDPLVWPLEFSLSAAMALAEHVVAELTNGIREIVTTHGAIYSGPYLDGVVDRREITATDVNTWQAIDKKQDARCHLLHTSNEYPLYEFGVVPRSHLFHELHASCGRTLSKQACNILHICVGHRMSFYVFEMARQQRPLWEATVTVTLLTSTTMPVPLLDIIMSYMTPTMGRFVHPGQHLSPIPVENQTSSLSRHRKRIKKTLPLVSSAPIPPPLVTP